MIWRACSTRSFVVGLRTRSLLQIGTLSSIARATRLVILIDSHPRNDWLMKAVEKRLREELEKLRVEINEEKSRITDLAKDGSFAFLGFEYRLVLGSNRKWRRQFVPKLKKRTALFSQLREIFRHNVS